MQVDTCSGIKVGEAVMQRAPVAMERFKSVVAAAKRVLDELERTGDSQGKFAVDAGLSDRPHASTGGHTESGLSPPPPGPLRDNLVKDP